MKQPRKDVLREQLALAADESIRLRMPVLDSERAEARGWAHGYEAAMKDKPRPWWSRWFA
jgi:hypothetical protein